MGRARKAKRIHAGPLSSNASKVRGSHSSPVSSFTSLRMAATMLSPGSILPAGRYHLPRHSGLASCTSSTLSSSLKSTAKTT